MVFLLNRERILMEVIELARLRISDGLGISDGDVSVKLSLEDGKIRPSFDIYSDIPESDVTSVIKSVWGPLSKELSFRIEGLGDRRVTAN